MKKVLTNVVVALVLFLGFQINAKAVYVSFNDSDNGNKVGYMEGVSLRNGEMDINIVDSNPNDGIDPNNMTREGYDFAGWVEHQPTPNDNILTIDNVNNKISFSADGDGQPRDVYATWTPTVYNINLDITDGTSTNPTTYTIEDDAIEIAAPTREGYNFLGWTDETGVDLGMTYIIRGGSTGDVNLVANWEAIVYTITYELDGGEETEENPTSYTADDEITLNNPTKEGYEFIGWTSEDITQPTVEVIIPLGSTGDKAFAANWEEIVQEINGEGTSDLDDVTPVKSLNPQTGDNIISYAALLVISGCGVILNKRKKYNN